MPRGGKRSGSPGTAYSNRSDLSQPNRLPASAPTGQPYGAAGAQLAAQQAAPMASGPQLPQGSAPPPEEPYSMPQVTPLDADTSRPNEPVTAGLPVGPGPGPEALGGALSANDDVETQLRAAYARYPTEQLRALIEMIDDGDV